jgi:hypothetical protein
MKGRGGEPEGELPKPLKRDMIGGRSPTDRGSRELRALTKGQSHVILGGTAGFTSMPRGEASDKIASCSGAVVPSDSPRIRISLDAITIT